MKRISFLLFILLVTSLKAQPGNDGIYSLQECIEIASNNNYRLIVTKAQINSAAAQLTAAFGQYLPGIDFNLGYRRTLEFPDVTYYNGQVIPIPQEQMANFDRNNYSMSLMGNYIIFDGFAREARYNQAEETFDASFLNHEFTVATIKNDVYTAYINVIRNQQIVKIRQENLKAGQNELERIKAQYEAGVIPVISVYSQEAQLANDELQLVQAENDFDIAKTQLLTLMGMNPDKDVQFLESSLPTNVTDNEVDQFQNQLKSLTNAINTALDQRNDYKAQRNMLQVSKDAVKIAQSQYYPQLFANGGWNWQHVNFSGFNQFDGAFINFGLQLPIFSRFQPNYEIQNAKVQVAQNEVEYLQLEQTIRAELKKLFLQLDAAQKQLEITQRSVFSAEKNFEAARETFRIGTATVSDYILANTQYITSQINRVTAIYNYLQLRQEILYQMGMFE